MNLLNKKTVSICLILTMLCNMIPMITHANDERIVSPLNRFEGKKVSILGDSISTYNGVSNNSKYNSTLNKNIGFYPISDVTSQAETWWQQVIDILGMKLCVNNSSGGGRILSDEKLSTTSNGKFTSYLRNVAAYKERCINLHNIDGEKPDVILVFLGTNDFSYHLDSEKCEKCKELEDCDICHGTNTCPTCLSKSGLNPSFCPQLLGNADINSHLISQNQDGSFTYLTPKTTLEAYAIMLHKMNQMYPNAEIYCMGLLTRRNPDYPGGYHDHGQPTSFNTEMKKVVERFGATFVDLESCGIEKDSTVFDRYIYDKAVHPNAAGMDKITEAVISTMIGTNEKLFKVSSNLTNAKLDGNLLVNSNASYNAKIIPIENDMDITVTVTMNEQDVTSFVYSNGVISIPCVTGDIIITAVATRKPENFRWEFDGNNLTSKSTNENSLTKLSGSIVNGLFSNTRYKLQKSILLLHNRPWVIEWQGEGNGGFMLSKDTKTNDGNKYFFHRSNNSLEAFGYWNFNENTNFNYGVCLQNIIDMGSHKYRIENRIIDDSNMIYLIVDNEKEYCLNNFYHGGTPQGTTEDWICGQDFIFNYIGTTELPLTNYKIDYLEFWENGFETLLGDINQDSKVNQLDRVILARYLAKWIGYELIQLKNSDLNLDGKVNQFDRVILARYLAKWNKYEILPYVEQ